MTRRSASGQRATLALPVKPSEVASAVLGRLRRSAGARDAVVERRAQDLREGAHVRQATHVRMGDQVDRQRLGQLRGSTRSSPSASRSCRTASPAPARVAATSVPTVVTRTGKSRAPCRRSQRIEGTSASGGAKPTKR